MVCVVVESGPSGVGGCREVCGVSGWCEWLQIGCVGGVLLIKAAYDSRIRLSANRLTMADWLLQFKACCY